MNSESAKYKDFFQACKAEDNFNIQKFILNGCDPVITQNEHGQTALHIAALHGNMPVVHLLVEIYDCNPTVDDYSGCTAIHLACKGGSLNIVSYLLQMVPKLNPIYSRDHSGNTILHYACLFGNVPIVRFLMNRENINLHFKINVFHDKLFAKPHPLILQSVFGDPAINISRAKKLLSVENNVGETALHVACRAGFLSIIRYFFEEMNLKENIQLEFVRILMTSVLMLAYKFGHHDILYYLHNRNIRVFSSEEIKSLDCDMVVRCVYCSSLHKQPRCHQCGLSAPNRLSNCDILVAANKNIYNKPSFIPPLNLACQNGDLQVVVFLIKTCKHNPQQEGALHSACVSNNLDLVSYLVSECNCDPKVSDKDGNTSLHKACKWGCLPIVKFLIDNDPSLLNTKNMKKETGLHVACFHARSSICQFLASFSECDTVAQNYKNETPLHIACYHPYCDIIICLITKTSKDVLNCPDELGDTPLFNACRTGDLEVVKQLTRSGSNPFYINKNSREMPVHIACRLQRKDMLEKFFTFLDDAPINHRNIFGQTTLHLACINDSLDIIRFLLEHSCDQNIADSVGQTPLHIASTKNNLEIAECFLTLQGTDLNAKSMSGYTALQYACKNGLTSMVELLMKYHPDITITDKDGNTPIHIACAKKNIEVLQALLNSASTGTFDMVNNAGVTPLHIACNQSGLDTIKYLVNKKYCSPNCITARGQNTPLHLACKSGRVDIVAFLVSFPETVVKCNSSGLPPVFVALEHSEYDVVRFLVPKYCDPTIKSRDGVPLFHMACLRRNVALLQYLVEQAKCDPTVLGPHKDTALHLSLMTMCFDDDDDDDDDADISEYLINVCHSKVNQKNEKGFTPLHIACRNNDLKVVRLLLQIKRINISPRASGDRTPIQLTRSYEIIKLLIGHGANPQDVYDYCGSILEKCKEEQPLHNIVKIFVVGKALVGKTTLVEALKREGIQTKLVKNVECRTTGIVKSEFKSKVFGRVSFNDFAGQPEFYSSHSQFLANAPLSQAIVLIVINMSESEAQISENLKYWVSFVTSQCTNKECIPKLLFIGSHIDEVIISSDESSKLHVLKQAIESSKCSLFQPVLLDCRNPTSIEINKLRRVLSKLCTSLRRNVQLDCQCHVLFAFLHSHFKNQSVIQLTELIRKIRRTRSHPNFLQERYNGLFLEFNSNDSEDDNEPRQVELLPYVSHSLVDLLKTLSIQGHILLLKSQSKEDKYWIILDQDVLSHSVNGTLFAPDSFKTRPINSNVGVLPLFALTQMSSGLGLDIDVIIHYLVYCEFCHRIEDPETLQLISSDVTSAELGTDPFYYFFPCFIKIDKPVSIWKRRDEQMYCSGWCLQCGDFFTNNFLHVLLLRLTFKYAVSASDSTSSIPFNRKCDIWKNGIHWCTRKGVEILIELTHNCKFLLLLVRPLAEGLDTAMECVKLRASVIRTVFDVLEKTCPGVDTSEHLIYQDLQKYPECDMMLVPKIDVTEIAETIKSGERFVFGKSTEPVDLEKLLFFEPYTNFGESLLASFYDANSEQVIQSSDSLNISPCFLHRKDKMVRMMDVSAADLGELEKLPACQNNQSLLIVNIIDQWKTDKENGGDKGSFSDLRETFDRYSIFNGRNPLLVCKCKKHDQTTKNHS